MTDTPSPDRGERRFYRVVGALTLLLASLPYLWGYLTAPPGTIFTGFPPQNIDDTAVYFAWMRQAEAGHFFLRNQFTTEPQRGVVFNLFFWLLGTVARITHLSLAAVFHGARIVCGALLLWAVARLLRETLTDTRARRTAFALVCVSAGFGWIWALFLAERPGFDKPIDLWQPEAVTFLSLYINPLFPAALALMALFCTAVVRAERTGQRRDIWPATVAGALLGNFHSYDVIHLFAVWGAFRVITDLRARRIDPARWSGLALAALATLPTTAYQYWAIQVEPVFRERAFATFTHSVSPIWLLLGFGLPALLALGLTARTLFRAGDDRDDLRSAFSDGTALRFLVTWAVAGVLISYVPVAFQRKMLMGAQLPICLLAGPVLVRTVRRLPGNLPQINLVGAVLLTVPTNGWFLAQELGRLSANVSATPHRPRLTRGEMDALRWLREHTPPDAAVLVGPDPTSHRRFPFMALYPHLSVYVPAFAGKTVYNGHWSETGARFGQTLAEMRRFFRDGTPDSWRRELLGTHRIGYVLQVNTLSGTTLVLNTETGIIEYRAVTWPKAAPPYLRPVYANRELTIYQTHLP